MKTIHYSFLRAVAALILGLVMVLFPGQAGEYLVVTLGVLFLLPSLISIIGYFAASKEARPFFPIVGIGSALFGLWLMIMPGFFADALTFLLGFILVLGGMWQIVSLSLARRWVRVPAAAYIVPVLIAVVGIVSFLYPTNARQTVFILIGAAWIVFAVTELTNWFLFSRKKPKEPSFTVEVGPDDEP
ncbi:MAG: DUF308 domain-containing protein [Prevotellaceae bacterium]|jgi:uncharacterized membrane protein HdeD (DUF308 family)|nr:DUF308 domain-containing protein [Prevotellaceae bacterium]